MSEPEGVEGGREERRCEVEDVQGKPGERLGRQQNGGQRETGGIEHQRGAWL